MDSKELEKENQRLKAQLASANQQIDYLRQIIAGQKEQLFGKKTEVIEKVVSGQESLFSDEQLTSLQSPDLSVTEVTETKVIKAVRHHSKRKKSGQRTAFFDSLPQVNESEPLSDQTCPNCHHELKKVGTKLVRREVCVKPAELYCKNYYQATYKCENCHPGGKDILINSRTPKALLNHSYLSSSILAQVANYKFNLALPCHRQMKLWHAVGLPVQDKALDRALIKVSQRYLKPLYQALIKLIQCEAVIHMDETPFQVLDSRKANGYFWVTRTTKEFSHHQIGVFHYANSRSGQMVGKILGENYPGIIMCDGYNGYSNRLYPRAKFGSCLVHIRREFIRITKLLKPNQRRQTKAWRAIELLSHVFHKENGLKYQSSKEKLALRKEKIKPLLDQFYDYLVKIEHPMGKLRKAIENAQRLRQRVYRIFENGQVPLSNNAVEQTIRPSTLIRKNCLFAKSTAGAEANAVFYTLVATAKMNQLNPYRYFKYLFEELPNRKTVSLEAYLPWAKVIQENCHQ